MSESLDLQYPFIPFDPSLKAVPVPWLVDGFFQLGKINGVFGFEKSGKSRLLTWLLLHCLAGKDVWNIVSVQQPRRILWLAGEEQLADITARIQRMAVFAGIDTAKLDLSTRLSFMPAAGYRMDIAPWRKSLEMRMLAGGYDTLIIDPLRRVHGGDENDNTMMAQVFNDWRMWSNQYGITLLIVHHTGHQRDDANWNRIATWARGATDLPAILDTAIFVERLIKANSLLIRRQGRYVPRDPLNMIDGNEVNFAFKLASDAKV